MQSIAEGFNKLAKKKRKGLTPKQKKVVDDFYEILQEWNEGRLSFDQAEIYAPNAKVMLHIAVLTPPDHAMHEALQEYLTIRWKRDRGRGYMTAHGWMPEETVEKYGGRLTEEFDEHTGEIILCPSFPTGYVTGVDGKHDPELPIFGRPMFPKPPNAVNDDPIDPWFDPEWDTVEGEFDEVDMI